MEKLDLKGLNKKQLTILIEFTHEEITRKEEALKAGRLQELETSRCMKELVGSFKRYNAA